MSSPSPEANELTRSLDLFEAEIAELELYAQGLNRKKRLPQISDAILHTALDTVREGIAVIQTNPLRLIHVNRAMTWILGYSEEELTSMSPDTILNLLHPDDRALLFKLMHQQSGSSLPGGNCKFRLIANNGTEKWISASFSPLMDRGNPVIVAGFSEFTEHRHTKQAFEHALKLLTDSSQLQIVGRLVPGVAHELNNPLMAILGYAEVMLMQIEDSSIREDVQSIYDDTKRAIDILRDLHQFARFHKSEPKYVSVNEAITKSVRLRAYELLRDNIKISIDLFPRLPYTLADFQQLQHAFLQLLINAEEAVRIKSNDRRVWIRSEYRSGTISVFFIDNGPGVSESDIDRIFDPTFTTKEGRNGLGLTVCRHIIRSLEGNIDVQQVPNGGAMVQVNLPVRSD